MITAEIKNSSSVEMFKNRISGSLTTVTANFVKILGIELDMLTWLMTNPFVASVLILVIADPGILSNTNWRDAVSISKCGRIPECASEYFIKFLFTCCFYSFVFGLLHIVYF